MLAQNFLSAADLDIGPPEVLDALIKVLGMLERGELIHVPVVRFKIRPYESATIPKYFNMSWVTSHSKACGTACCIMGFAQCILNKDIYVPREHELNKLFFPQDRNLHEITTDQAARTLRGYLTTGEVDWSHLTMGGTVPC
jgi:hypothetical protein